VVRKLLLLVLLACLGAARANAAGVQLIDIPASGEGAAMTGAVWYPCTAPPVPTALGRMRLPAVQDCPVAGAHLPLVVISHGFGGKFTSHHDTAEALADAGFVVAAINHPIDAGPDMSRADTPAWFAERPADMKRLVDFMLGSWRDHGAIDAARIGVFGFSRGGYTALVLAGADPDLSRAGRHCDADTPAACAQHHAGGAMPVAFTHDPRIRAAVVADPGPSDVFTPAALHGVTVPVQLWASQFSGEDKRIGVSEDAVAAIRDALPNPPDFHLVENAGHFAFLTPCPPPLAQELPRLCVDRPGFDRVAFHHALDAAVVAFFERTLPPHP
jgi:predicted dienelactone hydrolase